LSVYRASIYELDWYPQVSEDDPILS